MAINVHTSKRHKANCAKIEIGKLYAIEDAIALVKECANVKFKESVEVAIKLGIDARKSDQGVRGATVLPNGTGKTQRVAVFAQGEQAEKAKAASADIVGFEDLAEQVKKGHIDFDVVIATPDAMRVVGQLGQILGPKGLMPNPKIGTVTADVVTAVKNAKGGQVRYRSEKTGIVQCIVGKTDFEVAQLQQNIEALLADLRRMKPANAKGAYFKKLMISSTMGPSVTVDLSAMKI